MSELPHLLIVDDDTRLRELLRKYLADNSFIVTAVADTREARQHLAVIEFDLIILDIRLWAWSSCTNGISSS